MAVYPIEIGDLQGIADVINYVASGPSGLGQYNVGFNKSTQAYITGNYRLPYSKPSYAATYRAPIALSTSTWLDDYTWQFNFASTQFIPPFALGNNITVAGVTPADYDGTFGRIGVVFCDENTVIARSPTPYPNPGSAGTGGTVSLEVISFDFPVQDDAVLISTDCNGIVNVVGPEDFVNLSAQITTEQATGISGKVVEPGSNGNFGFSTQLNRYKAFNSGTAANPEYFYEFDATVAEHRQQLFLTGGVGQILTVSIDASSGTKVNTTPSGFFATIASFQTTTTGVGVNQTFNIDLPSAVAGAYTTTNTLIDITNPGYLFADLDLITIPGSDLGGVDGVNDLVLRVDSATTLPSNITIDPTTVFTTLLDNPEPGLYWYILEFSFQPQAGGSDVIWYVTDINVGRRSLTAQIIKK